MDRGALYTIAPPKAGTFRDAVNEHWTWHAQVPPIGTLDPIADGRRRSRGPVNLAHVFGRFRVASFDGIDLAILVRHVDSPVYAMRLAAS